jgi:hypothetical protein
MDSASRKDVQSPATVSAAKPPAKKGQEGGKAFIDIDIVFLGLSVIIKLL